MRNNGETWWLPGFDRDAGTDVHRGRTRGGRHVLAPRLAEQEARQVADTARAAALEAREARSTREVARAASRAARRLADSEQETGRRAVALLAEELGWTAEAARGTLMGMARAWSEDALMGLVERELGGPAALDGFVDAPPAGPEAGPRRRRAVGPPLMFVVHAGNVPGVAVTAALRGLLVRSGVLCKAPEDEPGLLALFARELSREDPLLARSVATTWWPGGEEVAAEEVWSRRAGTAVVYGGEGVVRALRSKLPVGTDLVVHGPGLGVGAVLADVADGPPGAVREAAAALARDVCAYEQAGCVSPRVVYVLGPDVDRLAVALAGALEEETGRRPPSPPTPEEAVALRSLRAGAEFRGYGGGAESGETVDTPGEAADEPGDRSRLLASADDFAWTVLAGGGPAPVSEGLPRVVRLHAVASLDAMESALEPVAGKLQTLGYAGHEGRGRLAEAAVRLGVCRVAPFGSVAWPPPDWRHDGRPQLLPLLRWTDLEG